MTFLFNDKGLGIETIKKVFIAAFLTGRDIAEAVKDGVQLMDGLVLWKNKEELTYVYSHARQAWAEFKDLSPAESKALIDDLARELNLGKNEVETKILKALKLTTQSYQLAENIFQHFNDWRDWARTL